VPHTLHGLWRIMTALAALKVALATIMRTELEHLRVEC
jgi:hypothetical protein